MAFNVHSLTAFMGISSHNEVCEIKIVVTCQFTLKWRSNEMRAKKSKLKCLITHDNKFSFFLRVHENMASYRSLQQMNNLDYISIKTHSGSLLTV